MFATVSRLRSFRFALRPKTGGEWHSGRRSCQICTEFESDPFCTLGYTVFEASCGSQALTLLDQHLEINLLLSDVIMPGMNGRQLVAHAVRVSPGLRVILTTGFEEERSDQGDREVLRKPFSLSELAKRVRRELDGLEVDQQA